MLICRGHKYCAAKGMCPHAKLHNKRPACVHYPSEFHSCNCVPYIKLAAEISVKLRLNKNVHMQGV